MTANRTPQDEQLISGLLRESGQKTGTGLEEVLHEIRALASGPAPRPSGELVALLRPDADELAGRRWARRHRTGMIALAVVGALSFGATAAAASSPQFRELAQDTVVNIINHYTPFHVAPPQRPAGGENPPTGNSPQPPRPSTSPKEQGKSTSYEPSDGPTEHGQSSPPSEGETSSGQSEQPSSKPSDDSSHGPSSSIQSSSPPKNRSFSGQDQLSAPESSDHSSRPAPASSGDIAQ
jgi:hypothetical protein